jgi:hypothetical protein
MSGFLVHVSFYDLEGYLFSSKMLKILKSAVLFMERPQIWLKCWIKPPLIQMEAAVDWSSLRAFGQDGGGGR